MTTVFKEWLLYLMAMSTAYIGGVDAPLKVVDGVVHTDGVSNYNYCQVVSIDVDSVGDKWAHCVDVTGKGNDSTFRLDNYNYYNGVTSVSVGNVYRAIYHGDDLAEIILVTTSSVRPSGKGVML